MPELKPPTHLTPEQEKEVQQNLHNDLAAKKDQPNLPPVPHANA